MFAFNWSLSTSGIRLLGFSSSKLWLLFKDVFIIFILFELVICLHVDMGTVYVSHGCEGQRRALDSPETEVKDGCQLPCEWCESNHDLLQEEQELLTIKKSLKPQQNIMNDHYTICSLAVSRPDILVLTVASTNHFTTHFGNKKRKPLKLIFV